MAYRSRGHIHFLAVHYDCNTLVAVEKEIDALNKRPNQSLQPTADRSDV